MVNDTKKRKTSSTSSPTKPQTIKLTKEEVYNNVLAFEEHLEENNYFKREQFRECFDELNKIINEVKDLKADKSDEAKKKIAEKRIHGSLVIVKLKKLNRLDKLRLNRHRETLQKEKLQADSNRLKLQNLIYEANHLKKEINKCFSFKSEDEGIELVSLEEFHEKAPDSLKSRDTIEDDHLLRKARLEFELQQRKEYSKQCKNLEIEREEIAEKTVEAKKNLDSIFPCLQEVIKSTRPIQEILNMPFEKEWEIQKLIRLLPQPLYLAYTKLCAYSEVIDSKMAVSIEGDEEEARIIDIERKSKEQEGESTSIEDNDDNNELDENEFDDGNHRKIKRRQSQVESLNQKRFDLFKHHPLSVKFDMNLKNIDESFSVILNYVPLLGFITVQGKFNIQSNGSVVAADLITQERILSSLYVDDFGDISPNPKTIFQLQSVQMNENDLSKTLSEKKLGKPYKWAQKLCGISFNELNPVKSQQLCEETVPDLVRQIRRKLKARMSLYNQVKLLENGKVKETMSVRVSSILQLFVSLSHAEYSEEICTKRFIQEGIVHANDVFFRAIITRGSAKLECYICIPANFPSENPFFALNLCWNDFKYNAESSAHIREIENLVNNFAADNRDEVLMEQLHRCMTAIDIFLESESSQHENPEFQTENNYAFVGFKNRLKPYHPKRACNLSSILFN